MVLNGIDQIQPSFTGQVCVPRPIGAASIAVPSTHAAEGAVDPATMACTQHTLVPGDMLYLPKGIVHSATTTAHGISSHVAVGVRGEDALWTRVWQDVLESTLADVVPEDDGLRATVRDVLERAQNASEGAVSEGTVSGVQWLSPMPLWTAGRWARAQGGQCMHPQPLS